MSAILSKILDHIFQIGVCPEDDAETRLHKNILSVASLAGAASLVLWSLPMFALGEPLAGGLWLVYALLLAGTLAAWAATRRGYRAAVFIHTASLLVFPFLLAIILGSFTRFGGAWYALLAMLAALVYYPRRFFGWCLAALATVLASLALETVSTPTRHFPPLFFSILYAGSFVMLGGITILMLYTVIRQRNTAYRLLQEEQQVSESLLLSILPEEIAARLKKDSRVIADQFVDVSVLFADIVNFTPLSAQMTAAEIVELLNEVFSYFDLLVEKYRVEKIKTIGDCYMAAAGVPLNRPDHALVLTRMALEIRDYVAAHEFRGQRLSFRIGINSGALVAGVIGRKKFSYDLWGDTVNLASRMESHGQGGVIQVTRATYELICNEFLCEPQGYLSVKGRGELEVWHVVGVNK